MLRRRMLYSLGHEAGLVTGYKPALQRYRFIFGHVNRLYIALNNNMVSSHELLAVVYTKVRLIKLKIR